MSEMQFIPTPAPLADAELAELARLSQVATAAPWKQVTYDTSASEWIDVEANSESIICVNINDAVFKKLEDAELVAAMRNALPSLLARLAAAEAPKWIAVGEGLPADEIDSHDNPFGTTLYLVARPATPYVSATALGYRYDGDWYIVQEGAGDEADFVDNTVTHWQPLPEAPAQTVKGGQQDA